MWAPLCSFHQTISMTAWGFVVKYLLGVHTCSVNPHLCSLSKAKLICQTERWCSYILVFCWGPSWGECVSLFSPGEANATPVSTPRSFPPPGLRTCRCFCLQCFSQVDFRHFKSLRQTSLGPLVYGNPQRSQFTPTH